MLFFLFRKACLLLGLTDLLTFSLSSYNTTSGVIQDSKEFFTTNLQEASTVAFCNLSLAN